MTQAVLGGLHIKAINKPLFTRLAEKRLADYRERGKKGNVQVNREITFISSALSWATSNLPELAAIGTKDNPLLNREKLPESQNDRYVTDEDYEVQYAMAGESLIICNL